MNDFLMFSATLQQGVGQAQGKPPKYMRKLFTIGVLMVCGFYSLFTGCATPTPTVIYKEKPQTVVTDSSPFNATDYERAAFDFRREGRLELAGAATERAAALRRAGDMSTRVTPFRITAKDLDEAARKFESEGKLELAQEARDAARYLREKERTGPVQPVRNRALVL